MALGSTTIDDTACKVFESNFRNSDMTPLLKLADIASIEIKRTKAKLEVDAGKLVNMFII